MKTVIIYKSKTGFTKRYAMWLKNEFSCEAYTLKDALKKKPNADLVIYGGWVFGGLIMGYNKIAPLYNNVYTFAVGSMPKDLVDMEAIMKSNNILNNFYYFTGGFKFKEHNFLIRAMLNGLKKSILKKDNKTKQDEYMSSVLGTDFDNTNIEYIKPLVSDISNL